jgi:hypothetical protein
VKASVAEYQLERHQDRGTNRSGQLDLGLRTPARALRLSRDLREIPLDRYKLDKDGRKWKAIARERMALAEWLATHGDADGSRIFPSVNSMIRHFGWSHGKTCYLLDDLKSLALLESEGYSRVRGTRRRRMNIRAFVEKVVGNPVENMAARAAEAEPESNIARDSGEQESNVTLDTTVTTLTDTKSKPRAAAAASSPHPPSSRSKPKTPNQEIWGSVRRMIPAAVEILAKALARGRRWANADDREALKEWAARNGIEYGSGDAISKAFKVAEGKIGDACWEEKRAG